MGSKTGLLDVESESSKTLPKDSGLDNDDESLGSMNAVISRNSDELEQKGNGEGNEAGSNTVVEKDPLLEEYHAACKQGDIKTIRDLVETSVIDLTNDYDPVERISGLHWAAINNRLSVVKYLVSAGADVNFKGGDLDATPLHWASKSGLVYIVHELLKAGADPSITDNQGYNLLHTSIFSSNIMLVIYVLFFVVDGKEDVDQPDPHLRTPLQWATYQADSLTVENLLKFGADVKRKDESGFTALHWGTVKGSVPVMDLLIRHGSDFFQTTNDGKNCFTIGQELYSLGSLETALDLNEYDKKGFPATKLLTAPHAKLITFFLPWVLIPSVFYIFANITFVVALLVNAIILAASGWLLGKVIIPSCLLPKRHALLKSPLFAGVLSGSIALCFFVWITRILALTADKRFFSNLVLFFCFIGLTVLLVKLIQSDPGTIPQTTDHDKVRETITELLAVGKFDAKHFCVHTWTRIPLRCKYEKDVSSLISRFDHYCPWVYNYVGLLNHKLFYMFVTLLEVSVWLYVSLLKKYFDELEDYLEDHKGQHYKDCHFLGDEDICFGFKHDTFNFLILAGVVFQGGWVLFLIGVQTVQILKGCTDYEFAQLNKRRASGGPTAEDFFSTTPPELMNDELLEELESPVVDPRQPAQRSCVSVCCAVLGIDKALTMIKSILRMKVDNSAASSGTNALLIVPTDYGWKQNVKDFWLLSDGTTPLWKRIFLPPKDSRALLNNIEVDYYTLYALPHTAEQLA